ncbi:MAG: helix-turn-helix transcriptional regulator [Erysipelotrichaceae bacterium]|nr:helix-turn-helix transcriptional regulator [Erysipelotrichaceae bacterium]
MIYQRIKNLREDNDLTQKDICSILHCSQQVYSDYELGKLDIPTDVLIKLAKFYNVSTDYLLNLKDSK